MREKPKNFIEMTGFKHFDLTVVGVDEEKTNRVNREKTYWKCQCVCGAFKSIDGRQLRNGKARKNCGCVPVPQKQTIKEEQNEHYHSLKRLKRIYNGMIQRCHNPNNDSYGSYGKKGIFVSDEWHNRDQFIKDMFPAYLEYEEEYGIGSATIDRIDNSKGYSKDNCRWLNMEGQLQNRTPPTKYQVEVLGVTYESIGQLQADYPDIAIHTMLARYRSGKRGEELIKPVKRTNPNKGKKIDSRIKST